ncbi:MAG: hypothetical protein Q8R01_02860 [Ramlibacter sp.]|nr:hypothetical protein [Ramlibacter sp.]
MPIRFSTEAANADHMRREAETGAPEGMPDAVGADGTPRDRADPSLQREPKGGAAPTDRDRDTAAKPGKDINAPGFVKDKDAGEP